MSIFGFTLSAADISLLGVVGILLSWLVPHRLSVWREHKTRRATACAAFKSVFLTELSSVYPVVSDWPHSMHRFLMPKFPAFQSAINNFRPYVPLLRRGGFDNAWLRFHNSAPEESDKPAFVHYSSATYAGDKTHEQAIEECRALFYKDVKHLLSFADET